MQDKIEKIINSYVSRYPLLKEAYEGEYLTKYDILFLIPNNVKRRCGLAASRTLGKRKHKIKIARMKHIQLFRVFPLIEEIIDQTIGDKLANSEFFGQFVDFKDISAYGESCEFVKDENHVLTMVTAHRNVREYLSNFR